jgi:hypothetical protein
LIEDVRDECNRFGQVLEVVVPRGDIAGLDLDVLGKIYVHLSSVEGAASVLRAVAGRKFNGLTVEASYFSEEAFLAKVSASLSLLRSLALTVPIRSVQKLRMSHQHQSKQPATSLTLTSRPSVYLLISFKLT